MKKSNKQAQLPQKHRLKNIKNTDFLAYLAKKRYICIHI